MGKIKVSVVIPNWNGADKLKDNLPEVLKVSGVDEVIVSDDASSDDSVALVKQNFPEVELVQRRVNGGFSSNVNTGVREARGEFVFLLNSDAVPEKDCLEYVTRHFERDEVFSVGLSSGGSWNWAKFENGEFLHNQYGDPKEAQFHQTLWASGGSMVFRKSYWMELGGLDELFDPFYVEDVDLGYRATKRGYINIFEPRARVEHYKEAGVIAANFKRSKVLDVVERNTLLLVWKNITDRGLLWEHMMYLARRMFSHPRYVAQVWRAFMKLHQLLKKRSVEAKLAKLTDREIFGLWGK